MLFIVQASFEFSFMSLAVEIPFLLALQWYEFIYLFLKYYLLIWLHRVLVVARGIATCRIFSCGTRALSCGRWDLVPGPGIEPRPPAIGSMES